MRPPHRPQFAGPQRTRPTKNPYGGPRPMTIRQWNRDHCSRARRAGTFVVMARSPEVVVMLPPLPPRDTADPPYGRGTGLACRIRRDVSPCAALPSCRTPVPLPERGRHRAPALLVRLRGARQKRYPSAEDAERYARAFDHEDAEDLGRRAPLVGLFPLRLLRAVRLARARRASAAPDDSPCHLEALPVQRHSWPHLELWSNVHGVTAHTILRPFCAAQWIFRRLHLPSSVQY